MTREELEIAVRGWLPAPDSERVLRHVRPGAGLQATPLDPEAPLPLSRLGGLPDLPDGMDWPTTDQEGEPACFLGQIDLAELAAAVPGLPLPAGGLLSFFADAPGLRSEATTRCEVHRFDLSSGALRRRAPPQAEFRFDDGLFRPVLAPAALRFHPLVLLPALRPGGPLGFVVLAGERRAAYAALRQRLEAAGEGPAHRLLGWPDDLPHPPEQATGHPAAIARLQLQLRKRPLSPAAKAKALEMLELIQAYETRRSAAEVPPEPQDMRQLLQLDFAQPHPQARPEEPWGGGKVVSFMLDEASLAAGDFGPTAFFVQAR